MMFKPLLADDANLETLKFPRLVSAKLDGIRAIVINGVVMSRRLKPIPNCYVQEKFKHLEYYDGELIYGDPTAKDCYRQTSSACMSHSGENGKDVNFYMFDHIENPRAGYSIRRGAMSGWGVRHDIFMLHQEMIYTLQELLDYEEAMLNAGYEGLILRDPFGPYKFGRSTVREAILLKLKRFVDKEFMVVGFEERMHNGNEAKANELGYMKRSSHQANKSGRGDLGALRLSGHGMFFTVGSGFDDALRAEIWNNQSKYLGKMAKVKYFPIGMKDGPRHPVFLGWRDPIDA